MRVGGKTSQLDLLSLTPLSVAGCGRLQLVPHWATSIDYCTKLIIDPTFCGCGFSTERLLAIEEFTFTLLLADWRQLLLLPLLLGDWRELLLLSLLLGDGRQLLLLSLLLGDWRQLLLLSLLLDDGRQLLLFSYFTMCRETAAVI